MVKSDCIINSAKDIKLAVVAHDEFGDAADYIWKAPRLIESERNDELAKLPAYFPSNPELAELRWEHESKKLENTFPYLMSRGNLFSVASLYEAYLILLAKNIEEETGLELHSAPGQGVSRINNYFKIIGLNYFTIKLYHQVEAALKIRNCLVHASGILSWSKEDKVIRQILASTTFLSRDHRDRRKKNKANINEVNIVTSSSGDHLEITNEYSWLACWLVLQGLFYWPMH